MHNRFSNDVFVMNISGFFLLLHNKIYGSVVIIKKFGNINEDICVTDSHAVKLKTDSPWRDRLPINLGERMKMLQK